VQRGAAKLTDVVLVEPSPGTGEPKMRREAGPWLRADGRRAHPAILRGNACSGGGRPRGADVSVRVSAQRAARRPGLLGACPTSTTATHAPCPRGFTMPIARGLAALPASPSDASIAIDARAA
jgi:hypothetical protein